MKECQGMSNDLGYAQAQEFLQKTFGQKFQFAKACVDSLTQDPVLHQNDKAPLMQFSAEVNSCMNTLVGLDYLHKMDNFDVLPRIARRLPISWLNGWQAKTDNLYITKCAMLAYAILPIMCRCEHDK